MRRDTGWIYRLLHFSAVVLPLVALLSGAAARAAAAAPVPAAVAAATTSLKGYMPMVPQRICDTRAATPGFVAANQCDHDGSAAGTLGPAASMTVAVAGAFGVPASAKAVVLNVTATDTTAVSYLTVWPAGSTRPTASNMNWGPGQVIPNLVEVGVGSSGAVSVYNNQGQADVVIDLEGYVDGSAPNLYTPLGAPFRICDTRPLGPGVGSNQCQGSGGSAGTIHSAATQVVTVTGLGGVPASATAVVLNVTVTGPAADGYFTVWPDGTAKPVASSLNWFAGQTVPNRVMVGLGSGKIDVFLGSAGPANLVIDVSGYFSVSAGGSGYFAIPPTRVCDTRPVGPGVIANSCNDPAQGGPAPLGPGDEVILTAPPAAVSATAMNVTVTDTSADSFLTVFPVTDPNVFTAPPVASDLNWGPGQVKANFTVASQGTANNFAFYNNAGSTNLVVDVEGVYTTTPTPAAARPMVRIFHLGIATSGPKVTRI